MIKVTKINLWRSEAAVNSNYDMARIQLDMPLGTWRLLKKHIKDSGYFNFKDVDKYEE
jgi:hypothetical protein